MCCRVRVRPVEMNVARAMLVVGQFQPSDGKDVDISEHWFRDIDDENTRVQIHFEPDGMLVALQPSVASWPGHLDKRIAASVMFEIAAKYAEAVGGEITQEGINVAQCKGEIGTGMMRPLASYPSHPLQFSDNSNICPGWKAVFTGALEEFGNGDGL